MNDNFDPPPRGLSALVVVGGVLTAIAGIAGLQQLSRTLDRSVPIPTPIVQSAESQQVETLLSELEVSALALADVEATELPGDPISLDGDLQSIASPEIDETTEEMAEYAWRYFKANIQPETGLVNSADGFPAVTLWDQGAALAAMVTARELELWTPEEFATTMTQTLESLAKLPLYNDELPNKVYNSKTLEPINYGVLDETEEVGWSAIDLGRMALWLKIVGARYPEFKAQTEAIWQSWDVSRLTQGGHMYGATVIDGTESYYQEGRLGYENYGAYGLKLWGLEVDKALDTVEKTEFVSLYGVSVPYDKRDYATSQAHNYVLSEPYFLDGIETGFQALPQAYSDQILAAQQARFQATGQLTAVTEDNLDRAPYFLYNTLFANGDGWASITDTGENYNELRFISTKAAVGWHSLYNTDYTQLLYQFVLENLQADNGWYGGYYESLLEPNTSVTANNNGVILECLLFQKVGQPLLVWAGVE
jgi:hypothetical protein